MANVCCGVYAQLVLHTVQRNIPGMSNSIMILTPRARPYSTSALTSAREYFSAAEYAPLHANVVAGSRGRNVESVRFVGIELRVRLRVILDHHINAEDRTGTSGGLVDGMVEDELVVALVCVSQGLHVAIDTNVLEG